VLTGSVDGGLIWDVAKGKVVRELSRGMPVRDVAWSSDGARVVTASSMTVVWDVRTGRAVGRPLPGSLQVAISRDGSRVLADSAQRATATVYIEEGAQVWDVQTGQAIGKPLRGGAGRDWSPDGSRVATASNQEGVRVWDTLTGQLLYSTSQNAGGVKWSPDGTRIVTYTNRMATIWDVPVATSSDRR
jgi:WD40 repeat protein